MLLGNKKALESAGAAGFVRPAYLHQAEGACEPLSHAVRCLLAQRRLPEHGWRERDVERLLADLAALDSNNFARSVGVGEREGRVYSALVARRHFYLTHGVGRSGDLAAEQPKAAGSTLLHRAATFLALDAVHALGVTRARACLLTPVATGMTAALAMLALRAARPDARFVVWARVDQKSCLKAVRTAGLVPVAVDCELVPGTDAVRTRPEAFRAAICDTCGGPEHVLCVLTATSCFAPREPDDVVAVAALCAELGVPHIINNAYGLQAGAITHAVNEAMRVGRVDAVVQSTDKAFLVPVGGGLLFSADEAFVAAVARSYAGRASAVCAEDMLITLLEMGRDGLAHLVRERKRLFAVLRERVAHVAEAHGERLLAVPRNPISLAITMDNHTTTSSTSSGGGEKQPSVGSMLFQRCCSGARMFELREPVGTQDVCGVALANWGCHCSAYRHSYLNVACAVGMEEADIDVFCKRLDSVLTDFEKAHHAAAAAPHTGG